MIGLIGAMVVIGMYSLPSRSATYAADQKPSKPSAEEVREYVSKQADALGLSPYQKNIALFIIQHESTYCWRNGYFQPDILGDIDKGGSRGCWQIFQPMHQDVPSSCANDLACSTNWSLKQIKSGHAWWWSSWKYRCDYYGVDCR